MRKDRPRVQPGERVYVVVRVQDGKPRAYADGLAMWTPNQREAFRFRDCGSSIRPWGCGWAKAHAEHMRQTTNGGEVRVVRLVAKARRKG